MQSSSRREEGPENISTTAKKNQNYVPLVHFSMSSPQENIPHETIQTSSLSCLITGACHVCRTATSSPAPHSTMIYYCLLTVNTMDKTWWIWFNPMRKGRRAPCTCAWQHKLQLGLVGLVSGPMTYKVMKGKIASNSGGQTIFLEGGMN